MHSQQDSGTTPSTSGHHPRRRGLSGLAWLGIGLALFFAGGAVLSLFVKQNTPRMNAPAAASRSYFGIDGFEVADGGITFDLVEPAGGPADKAGLVGGDVVMSFDGHPVKTPEEMIDLLLQTPIGKTVEVIYLRDGVTKMTQLTTESQPGIQRLREVGDRPEGLFGFERDKTTRISMPETRTYGLRMDYIQPNSPADLFGIKEGDIITEFDKIPIRTSRELLSRVRRATPRSTVEVVVVRGDKTLKIPVTMGHAR